MVPQGCDFCLCFCAPGKLLGRPLVQGDTPGHNEPARSASLPLSLDACWQLLEAAMLCWACQALEPYPETLLLANSGMMLGPQASPTPAQET